MMAHQDTVTVVHCGHVFDSCWQLKYRGVLNPVNRASLLVGVGSTSVSTAGDGWRLGLTGDWQTDRQTDRQTHWVMWSDHICFVSDAHLIGPDVSAVYTKPLQAPCFPRFHSAILTSRVVRPVWVRSPSCRSLTGLLMWAVFYRLFAY